MKTEWSYLMSAKQKMADYNFHPYSYQTEDITRAQQLGISAKSLFQLWLVLEVSICRTMYYTTETKGKIIIID
jgi:hypothetical protein